MCIRDRADLAAKYNRNAEVKAFFASGQVRPIRVQSAVSYTHLTLPTKRIV